METDAESLVQLTLQRCVDELPAAGGVCPAEERAGLLERLAEHLRPAMAIAPEPDSGRLALQLVCRLWNLPLQQPLVAVTAQLSRQLAADVLLLLADPAARRPLPLPGAAQVLLAAARQGVAAGQLERALALVELARRDVQLRRQQAESQLATFARRADTLRQLAALEQARFACLVVRAEALLLRGDAAAADEAVREAGGARDVTAEQQQYLQRLLFNFGLREYRRRDWPQAVRWLQDSLQIGQQLARSRCPADLRARTLDLLARSHMMTGEAKDLDRAVQLLQLAFSECPSLTVRLLTLTCELRRAGGDVGPTGGVQHCAKDAADWCRQPADFLQLSELLEQHDRRQEALEVLQRAGGGGLVCRRLMRLLLQLDRPDEALQVVSQYCSLPADQIEADDVAEMVALLEVRADTLLAAGRCGPAGDLLQALAGLPKLEPETAARLLRNLARCRRSQGELAAAEGALRRSLQLRPGHPAALYMLLQQLIVAEDTDGALALLPLIDEAQDGSALARLWRNLCGFALSRQMSAVYERLLEVVLRHLDRPVDAIPLLQCLVRSRIESLEGDEVEATPPVGPLMAALETALGVVQRCQADSPGVDRETASWFSDVAWNVAVRGELDPADRCRLFSLSRLLLPDTAQDPSDLSLCRTAAVMSAAAALEAARQPGLLQQEKHAHLREALSCVAECERLSAKLGSSTGWVYQSSQLLYQFEAMAGLDSPQLGALLETTLKRPDVDTDTLETMAGLAGRPALAVRALRAAAERQLRASPSDCDRVAALQTRYLSLMLDHIDAPGLPADEVLRAVIGVRDAIRTAAGRYPNMTTLFVLTRTWNHAVLLCLQGQNQLANRWAAVARGFVSLLAAQTEWYRHRTHQLHSIGDLTAGEPPPTRADTPPAGVAGNASSTPCQGPVNTDPVRPEEWPPADANRT